MARRQLRHPSRAPVTRRNRVAALATAVTVQRKIILKRGHRGSNAAARTPKPERSVELYVSVSAANPPSRRRAEAGAARRAVRQRFQRRTRLSRRRAEAGAVRRAVRQRASGELALRGVAPMPERSAELYVSGSSGEPAFAAWRRCRCVPRAVHQGSRPGTSRTEICGLNRLQLWSSQVRGRKTINGWYVGGSGQKNGEPSSSCQ